MARGDYGPEIRSALSQPGRGNVPPAKQTPSSAADKARDAARGIPEGSPEDEALDKLPQNQPGRGGASAPQRPPGVAVIASRPPGAGGGVPPDLHHVAAATSIAHAILGGRSGVGGA